MLCMEIPEHQVESTWQPPAHLSVAVPDDKARGQWGRLWEDCGEMVVFSLLSQQ